MPPPALDVVICTYNTAPLLARTLEALAWQEVPAGVAWRVLVVDNNCTDGTAAVVERFRGGGAPAGPAARCSRPAAEREGAHPVELSVGRVARHVPPAFDGRRIALVGRMQYHRKHASFDL